MRKYMKVLLEWLHVLLILAIVAPVVYMTGLQRESETIYRIYVASYLLVLPVIVIKKAVQRCRKLIQYLVVFIGVCVGMKIGASKLGTLLLEEAAIARYVACMQLGTIAIAVEAYVVRIYKVRRQQARETQDRSWIEKEYALDKPKIFMSAWFVAIYVIALNFACPEVCNLALFSTMVYLLLAISYEYIDKMENYLKLNDNICQVRNIPYKRIFGIGKIFLIGYLCFILLAMIPAILTVDGRAYSDVRISAPRRQSAVEQIQIPQSSNVIPDLMHSAVDAPEEANEMSALLNAILYGFSVIAIGWILVVLFRWMRGELARFAQGTHEEEDEVEALEIPEEEEQIFHRRPIWQKTEEDKIRRIYRKYIRQHRKERPAAYETPTEIETAAGVVDTAEGKALHQQYELVRYGKAE